MTIPGFTDQELADLARKKGASEESVRRWLAETRRDPLPGCRRCAGTGWVCERHPHRPWAGVSASPDACTCGGAGMRCRCVRGAVAAPRPAPKPDRGRTGPKRASTPRRSEASVQREIVMALKAAGFYVRRIGQRNAKGTMDPGVPDLYAMRPLRQRGFALAFNGSGWPNTNRYDADFVWIEVKASKGGRQSWAQREFQKQCEHAGVRYILARSLDDVRELL